MSSTDSIELYSDDLEISIRGESDHFFRRDLYERAVTHLIEEADIHGWGKDDVENGGDYTALEDFCLSVLTALAGRYKFEADMYKPDGDSTKDAPQSLGAVMDELLRRLKEIGHLDTMIVPPEEDSDYDEPILRE